MSLANERMNVVLAFSAGIFGRRAEQAIKNSPDVACIAEVSLAEIVTIADVVMELRGERFERNQEDQVCLVLELGLRADLDFPVELGGRIVIATAGELRLSISAEAATDGSSTIDISLEYDELRLTLPLPPPDQQTLGEMIQTILQGLDGMIQTLLQRWLSEPIQMPLQALLGDGMELVGEPELTIGGSVNGSFRTLAIGLEIDLGTAVDRNHFRSVYVPPQTGDPFVDFFVLVESELMEIRIRQELRALHLDQLIPIWQLTYYKRAFWEGNGRNEDFVGGAGWRDYLKKHWWKHSVWLHTEGQLGYGGVEADIYLHAFADIRVQGEEPVLSQGGRLVLGRPGENLVLDLYIFELDFLDGKLRTFFPALSWNLLPIILGPAEDDSGLRITQTDSTWRLFQVRGWDALPGISGSPRLGVSSTDVAVEFGYESIGPDPLCLRYKEYGNLEGDAVVSSFDIYNHGQAPLWVCDVAVQQDPDAVFSVRPQRPLPWGVRPGGSMPVDVLLNVHQRNYEYHGAIAVRTNDFETPRLSITVHGFKESAPLQQDLCSRFDPPQNLPERIQELINLPITQLENLIGGRLPGLPPVQDPEPPCPECGYYMDLAFAGLSKDVPFELRDSDDSLIDLSLVQNNVHTFSAPIDPKRNLRIVTAPDSGRGKVEMSLRISQVSRVGLHFSRDRILALATERVFAFCRFEDGIGIVNVSDPLNPHEINRFALEKCNTIHTRNGHLYALTDSGLEVFSILDPYNLSLVHSIPVAAGATMEFDRDRLIILDGGKLTVYQTPHPMQVLQPLPLQGTNRLAWLQELRAKDPIESIVRVQNHYVLSTEKGEYILGSLEEDELSRAEPVPLGELSRNPPGLGIAKRKPLDSEQSVLQGGYILRVFDNRQGFSVLKRSRVPFSGRREALEDFFLERRGKQRHSGKTDRKYGKQS